MKIVQINVTYSSGSTGKIAYQIHQKLDKEKVDNKIIFGYGKGEEGIGYSMYSKLGTHLHSFLSRKMCMQGLCSWKKTADMIGFLKKEKPDIIHLHNIHGHYLNYPKLFKYLKESDIPVVWTFHDCWPFTGKCSHYFNAKCDKWKEGCYDCPNLATYPDSTYDGTKKGYLKKKNSFTSVDKLNIVCNSKWLKSQVEESFLKDKPIYQIYNGVDTEVFKPVYDENIFKKYNIPQNKFIVLGVSGVWKEAKGLNTFLELSKRIGEDVAIVMVGLTEMQIEALPKGITGITRTENMEELAKLYTMSDVLLNPSMEETFGMVAAESMACGTPVIVSTTTACPEVADEKTGICIDMSDISNVMSAIDTVKKNKKQSYTKNCVERIEKLFSLEKMCEKYLSLYEQLMAD